MDDELKDIRANMERLNEDYNNIILRQERNSRLLMGDEDLDFTGLLRRMHDVEQTVKTIETQRTLIKGVLWGLGAQGAGILVILGKIFS